MLTKTVVALLLAPLAAFAAPPGKKKKAPRSVQAPAKVPEPPSAAAPPAPVAPVVNTIALVGVRAQPGVPAKVASALEAGFDVELRKLEGMTVSSPAEVAMLLGSDRQKQLFGVAPSAGLSTLLAGIPAADVVAIDVGPVGQRYVINARRLARDGSVLKSSVLEVSADAGELASAAVPIVSALFPESQRRASLTTGRPPSLRPIRVAVGDVRGVGEIPPRALAALNQSITPELRKLEGVSAIASSELRDMLGMERQRQLMGCSETASSCMEELAGALDADEMVMLDLTLVGETYALTARRTDLRKGKVVQSQLKQFAKRDGEELLAITGTSIAALYPDRPLKPGRTRGVEAELIRRLNPPPLPRWLFLTTTGAAVAAGLVAGTFGWLSLDAERDFNALAQRSLQEPVPGGDFSSLQAKSLSNASTANILFAAAGGLALAALVETFFTDWKDDRAAFSAQPLAFAGGGGLLVTWRR